MSLPGLTRQSTFKVLCHSQNLPEQRGLFGTVFSTRRAPAVQVIAGLSFLMSFSGIDPGIQVNNMAFLFIWIAGSSPAMTIKTSHPGMTVK